MNKIGAVIIIIGILVAVNLLLLVVMPVVVDIVSTSNATITASSNLTNYLGSQGFLLSTPWILYFVPNVIGMIVVVIILRQP